VNGLNGLFAFFPLARKKSDSETGLAWGASLSAFGLLGAGALRFLPEKESTMGNRKHRFSGRWHSVRAVSESIEK
jgi:hypothetical protein